MNNNTFINDDETLCLLINGNEIKIPKQSKYYLLTLQKLTNALYQTKPKTFCFNFQGNFSKEDFNLYLKYISSNSNINNIIDTLFRFFQLIKVAKELIRIAKNLIALDEEGDGSGFQLLHDYEKLKNMNDKIANKKGLYRNFSGVIDWHLIKGTVKNATFSLTE